MQPVIRPQIPHIVTRPTSAESAPTPSELKRAAVEFEAAFIAEMLGHAGFGKAVSADSGFGGDAMSSLLLREYASMIAENGGLGFADLIGKQLARDAGDAA